jgi:hypothetical protein
MTELDVLGWLNGGDLAEAGLVRCCVEAKRGGQVVTYETKTGRKAKPKGRKFCRMGMTDRRPPDMVLENRETVLQGMRILRGSKPGFPKLPETPRYYIDPPPCDLEQNQGYWLVSDRMKQVLEAVDADAFAFVKSDVRLRNGEPGLVYWLCDVMRVLDALDEAKSRVATYMDGFNEKAYDLLVPLGAKLVFQDDAVGSAHIFRMAYYEAGIVCDEVLKDACKSARLKGIRFAAGEIARS